MKMCPEHWNELWREVRDRCLERFCARTTEAAEMKVITEEFDPVCAVIVDIGVQAFAHAGPACLLRKSDGGLKCPMCVLIETCVCGLGVNCAVRGWIKNAVDGQVKVARGMGLIGAPN